MDSTKELLNDIGIKVTEEPPIVLDLNIGYSPINKKRKLSIEETTDNDRSEKKVKQSYDETDETDETDKNINKLDKTDPDNTYFIYVQTYRDGVFIPCGVWNDYKYACLGYCKGGFCEFRYGDKPTYRMKIERKDRWGSPNVNEYVPI